MKRSLWIVAFLIIVGGFAGFQQYQSWSLNKPAADSGANPESAKSTATGERDAGRGQGRGGAGRGREAVPVLVVTAVEKTVPVQIGAVGNVEAYSTVSVKSQVTGVLQRVSCFLPSIRARSRRR
jgi:multidrug efflux pump subunit AcrA (membrane-fusion protein)